MGLIKAHEFISLDGVAENPSWTMEFGFDPKMGETLGPIMGSCSGILLGRVTYEMFAPVWSQRTAEDDPGAPFFNNTPKHIVTGTLTELAWSNSELLGAYDAESVRALQQRVDGDLYVSGSLTLVRSLIADGLLDELHLFMYPIALGAGAKLFGDTPSPTTFSLSESEAYENGVVHLDYRPVAR